MARRTEDALGHRKSTAYDDQDHVIQETDANGNATTYQYDGRHNVTYILNALGNRVAMTYSTNLLTSRRDAAGQTRMVVEGTVASRSCA